jgi:hypothetical protein
MCVLRWQTTISQLLDEAYGLWTICLYQWIELIELYLEPGWNSWNRFLDEYGKVLVSRYYRCHSENQYFGIFAQMVWVMENRKWPFDRAYRVALGTGLEQLEHVPGRIWEGFTEWVWPWPQWKNQYLEICLRTVWVMKNLKLPFDRAHRVVLGTGLEQLEHVPGRIWEGFTRIRC